MDELNERIARLEQAIDDLKNDMKEIKNGIKDLTQSVNKAMREMNGRITKLETKMEYVPSRAEVNGLKQKLNDHLEAHKRFWIVVGTIATVLIAIVTVAGMMWR